MPKKNTEAPASAGRLTAVGELERLAGAIEQGQLHERAKLDTARAGEQDVLKAVNRIVDALVAPLKVTSDYVENISKGVIPPKITDTYHGAFDTIKTNLNNCIAQLQELIGAMTHMSEEHTKGDIDVMIAAERFHGAYGDIARGVNEMVGGHISVKKKAMACVDEFARGNFDAVLEQFPGKKAFINDTIERLRANLKRFIEEMRRMSDEHNKGDIDVMIPAEQFEGAYRVMARG